MEREAEALVEKGTVLIVAAGLAHGAENVADIGAGAGAGAENDTETDIAAEEEEEIVGETTDEDSFIK